MKWIVAVLGIALTLCLSYNAVLASPEKQAETFTVIDHNGNHVTLPVNIERVVIDQVPLAATYVMYHGGKAPWLVGLSGSVLDAVSKTALIDIVPELKNVNTAHYDRGELNVEQLLNLKPDVVFYSAGGKARGEMLAQAGIPAVGFATDGDPTVLYAKWLRLLEDVFREPGKMDAVIAYGDALMAKVTERTAAIPDGERKTVMILFNYDNGDLRVSGSKRHFGHHWLRAANVINAAEAVSGVAIVNMEEIYGWQPDLIVMSGAGQCRITPVQVIANTVPGADFSPLEAVMRGQVYSNELGMWSWYTPNPDAPLVVLWLAKLAYPERFSDMDLADETWQYYRKFYHYDLSPVQMEAIYKGMLLHD